MHCLIGKNKWTVNVYTNTDRITYSEKSHWNDR